MGRNQEVKLKRFISNQCDTFLQTPCSGADLAEPGSEERTLNGGREEDQDFRMEHMEVNIRNGSAHHPNRLFLRQVNDLVAYTAHHELFHPGESAPPDYDGIVSASFRFFYYGNAAVAGAA